MEIKAVPNPCSHDIDMTGQSDAAQGISSFNVTASGLQYLSVFFLNATSLAKPNALQLLVQCDCAVITESWLTKKQQDTMFSMADYSLFRHDRKGGKAGGLCVYVRQNVACSVFETVNSVACPTDKIEIMWLECF